MKTKIKKWGNSLAIRIPKNISEELTLITGRDVIVSIKNNSILITPLKKKTTLEDLLGHINKDNLHDVYLDDTPQGKEIW